MNRIFVTGDIHRDYDIAKLNRKNFEIQSKLTKDDFLIVVGDFGACWYGGSDVEHTNIGYVVPQRHQKEVGKDDYFLNWYENRNYTTLFIDGNHENHKLLNTFPVEEWHGGLVHRIRPSVIHLMRGQIYTIGDRTFFTMGGAQSVDRAWRIENCSWWEEEMPSEEEYKIALTNLDKYNWKVDYVLTHCCGSNLLYRLVTHHRNRDSLTDFLKDLDNRLDYRMWYFGHHHTDRMVDAKHRALYLDVLEITE